jgi:hypothetical protein
MAVLGAAIARVWPRVVTRLRVGLPRRMASGQIFHCGIPW